MDIKNKKSKLMFGSVAQPGAPFGYGVIGERILKEFDNMDDVQMVATGDFDWDLSIVLGLPTSWIIGKKPRKDLLWHTMLEVTPIPPGWATNMNNSAGVWVPSNWVKELFRESGVTTPIIVGGYGVETNVYTPVKRVVDEREFKVVAWARSFVSRKNVMETIRVFINANIPNSTLDIKINSDDLLAPKGVDGHPEIVFIKEDWPKAKLARWLQNADAFIYLSEGEGFGLMPLEAMATGLPVICSYNTGMKDFLTEDNSYPVEANQLKYSQIYSGYFHYDCYGYKPDFNHAITLLRHVYENRDEAYKKGMNAAQMVSEMTWESKMKSVYKNIKQTFLN